MPSFVGRGSGRCRGTSGWFCRGRWSLSQQVWPCCCHCPCPAAHPLSQVLTSPGSAALLQRSLSETPQEISRTGLGTCSSSPPCYHSSAALDSPCPQVVHKPTLGQAESQGTRQEMCVHQGELSQLLRGMPAFLQPCPSAPDNAAWPEHLSGLWEGKPPQCLGPDEQI